MRNPLSLRTSLPLLLAVSATVLFGACRGTVKGGLETSCQECGLAAPSAEATEGLPNFGKIDDGLYRAGQPDRAGFLECGRHQIKTVVSVRSAHDDEALIDGCHLNYVRIPMHPWKVKDEDVLAFLKVATDPASRPVMLHCAHGQDRTGVLVASYRVVVQGWSKDDALAELEKYGSCFLWGNLRQYVRNLDVDAMRAALKDAPMPEIRLCDPAPVQASAAIK